MPSRAAPQPVAAGIHQNRSYLIGAAYVCLYVALDWASFIEPFGAFGITSWNPTAGLSLAFGLLWGRRMLPLLAVAPMLSEIIVRHMPAAPLFLLALSVVIGGVYSGAVIVLQRPAIGFDPALQRLRDVLTLIGVAILCALIVSCLYVGVLTAASLIAVRDFPVAALRYWIGDVIGILVTTPLILSLWAARKPSWPSPLVVVQVASIAFSFYVIFAQEEAPLIELFYLLFLPIIWMGIQGGLRNVSLGLAAAQVMLVISIQFLTSEQPSFTSLQAMMLVLALTGLAIGIVVDERRRAEVRLRTLQSTQAQLTRLASFNELSAALAHEINQPLSAATTYARIALEAMQDRNQPRASAAAAAKKSMAQVQRAADVVRKIRQLMRSGQSEPVAINVAQLVRDVIELAEINHSSAGIEIAVDVAPPGLQVRADLLQTQQVLINLLRNAFEALEEEERATRRIVVWARRGEEGSVELRIEDTGPGFREEQLAQPFEPFFTTKVDGLGVGLNLCRTIIHANGGQLSIANTRSGALVRFTLPEALEVTGEKEDLRRPDR